MAASGAAGRAEAVRRLARPTPVAAVGPDASGGYGRVVARTPPARVFDEVLGRHARTDLIDAAVVAR